MLGQMGLVVKYLNAPDGFEIELRAPVDLGSVCIDPSRGLAGMEDVFVAYAVRPSVLNGVAGALVEVDASVAFLVVVVAFHQ